MRSILPSGVVRFCALPPGSMWLAPTSLALPPSPVREVQVAVGAEGDRAAVVVAGVLAERDDLAARRRIDHVGIGGRTSSTR